MRFNTSFNKLLIGYSLLICGLTFSNFLQAQIIQQYSGVLTMANSMDPHTFVNPDGRVIISNRIILKRGFRYSRLNNDDRYNLTLKRRVAAAFLDVSQASSIEEHEELEMYPNPVQSHMTLSLDMANRDKVFVNVYGMDGKVYEQLAVEEELPIGRSSFQLDVDALAPGQYVLVLNTNTGKTLMKRFTKL